MPFLYYLLAPPLLPLYVKFVLDHLSRSGIKTIIIPNIAWFGNESLDPFVNFPYILSVNY